MPRSCVLKPKSVCNSHLSDCPLVFGCRTVSLLNNSRACFFEALFYYQIQNRIGGYFHYRRPLVLPCLFPLTCYSLFTPLLLTKMMVMMVMKQDARLSLDVFFLGRRLAPGLFVTNKTKLTFQKHLSHY